MSDLQARLNQALASRYEVTAELGQGGMATVFRARDLRHGREVALKAIHPVVAMALGSERFLREIEHIARLQHPHILPLLDSGTAGNLPFYVMPLVRGVSLRQRLDREGQLPIDEAIRLAAQIADALAYAHREGLIHRDIKPDNILLQDGHALVTDLGIARELNRSDRRRLTETGMAVGTPLYMSPEQAAAESRIDGRSDQYSLGCVLYEMIAGVPPFTGPSLQAVLARHSRDPVPPISTVRATVPPAVEWAIERALAKAPADRFATMSDFAAALVAPAPGHAARRRRGLVRRGRRRGGILAALIGGASLAGLGMFALSSRGSAPSLDPNRVGFFPFATRCTREYASWCDGAADLLSATFNGAGDLRTVDTRTTYAAAGNAGPAPLNPSAARRLARRLGAGTYALGSVTEQGGELLISAALYATGGSDTPLARGTARGRVEQVFRVVDQLAAQLTVGMQQGTAEHLTRLAVATTDSLSALKLFLTAESESRQGRFDSALVLLKQAVAIDAGFTMGWAALIEAASYTDEIAQVDAEAFRRVAGAAHLPWRDSLLVAATVAGSLDEAERIYRAMLQADSLDAGAWGALGDRLIHDGVAAGRSFREAQHAFAKAVALGDSSVRNINHLSWAAGVLRDSAAYDQALSLAIARSPDGFMTYIHRLELAVLRHDSAAERTARDVARRQPGGFGAWGAVQRLATGGRLRAAGEAARLLTEPSGPFNRRALGHNMLATFAAAQGQWREAQRQLALAATLDPLSAAEIGAYLALVPGMPTGRATLESLTVVLQRLRPPPSPAPVDDNPWVFPDAGAHAALREYLLGLASVRVGRFQPAAEAAGRLTSAGLAAPDGLSGALATSLRASVLHGRNRSAEALALLERRPPVGGARVHGSPFYSQAYERNLRADLLGKLGRDEEALIWYGNAGLVGLFDVAYLPYALRQSAEILERLGRSAEARACYQRLIELWSAADPELEPLIADARTRQDALARVR